MPNSCFAAAFLPPQASPTQTLEFQTKNHTLTNAQLAAGATTQLTTGPATVFAVPPLPAGPTLVLPAQLRLVQLCIIVPVDTVGGVYVGSSNAITPLQSAPLYPGELLNIPSGAYSGALWVLDQNNIPNNIYTVSI